ncbi:phosphonate C-P lyase system protein PhnG [Paracoccus aminophilus]|uniref:Alkylphosphonate utilization protein n=1 Tax=Paracoccus aminophilus JCM 7686 TaxID=1367847 RepID=S5XR08_PARAH|nr:phosphonate C-P lyase system protein PhnG [Paracoccus aminophilus]AGT09839.1 alkylphosphonate utilization protein [Paracoccus aminophilus JCM 7686]
MSNAPEMTRRDWMGLLARAQPARLAELFPELPAHRLTRAPEIGTVMVQGRTGGTGAPFNLGEVTVTRCALQLGDDRVGHAYVQGRDKSHALRAAAVDALLQGAEAARLHRDVLAPLAEDEAQARQALAEKAAATRVEFFTLVRGEDA